MSPTTNQDPLLANQIIVGLLGSLFFQDTASALSSVKGIPLPVMPFKPANRRPVWIQYSWQAAATPVDKEIYAVPAGYVFQMTGFMLSEGTTGAVGVTIRDGVDATGDTAPVIIQTFSNPDHFASLSLDPDYPITVRTGLRVNNSEQTANAYYRHHFFGYLEKKETAAVDSRSSTV